MQRNTLGLVATTVLTLFAVGCGADGPSAPPRSASALAFDKTPKPKRHASWTVADLDTVTVLWRVQPLRSDIAETQVIKPTGGDMHISAAGVTVHFPAGAVSVPTEITMTARAGWEIEYDFEPHGLQFAQPVTVTQDLHKTIAPWMPSILKSLEGVYFDDANGSEFLDPWHLVATVKEHEGGTTDAKSMLLTFDIHHFSGYLVSSGRKGSDR